MKRRSLLGLAASAFGASVVVGSGAFNTARADREVEVNVVNDVEAYLRINPLGTENEEGTVLGRSSRPDEQTRFRFPGILEEMNDLTQGDGLAPDSEYYFDSLVEVGNQGTNPVSVFTEFSGDITKVSIYDSKDPDRALLDDEESGTQLGTAETFEAGIYIDTTGMSTGESTGTLTFSANANGNGGAGGG